MILLICFKNKQFGATSIINENMFYRLFLSVIYYMYWFCTYTNTTTTRTNFPNQAHYLFRMCGASSLFLLSSLAHSGGVRWLPPAACDLPWYWSFLIYWQDTIFSSFFSFDSCLYSMVFPRKWEFTLQANAWGVGVFQDAFVISPRMCVLMWRRCRVDQVVPGIGVKHFLWVLAF
jgi:hypothetical protein